MGKLNYTMGKLNYNLNRKWVEQTLTKEDIAEWVKLQSTTHLSQNEIQHVANGMHNIYNAYHAKTISYLGRFLTAVVQNNLREAIFRADNTNTKALRLYVYFLYRVAPNDYKQVIV